MLEGPNSATAADPQVRAAASFAPMETDAALARLAAHGDTEAFDRLVGRYQHRVFALLRQRSPTSADAEDLTQETFLDAWRSIARFDPSRSFASWIMTIAVRRAASAVRSTRRDPTSPALRLCDDDTPTSADDDTDDGSVWLVARRVLTPDANTLLWLVYVEGLTPSAAARVVGRTPVSVRVTLHRARATLAQALEERREETR